MAALLLQLAGVQWKITPRDTIGPSIQTAQAVCQVGVDKRQCIVMIKEKEKMENAV